MNIKRLVLSVLITFIILILTVGATLLVMLFAENGWIQALAVVGIIATMLIVVYNGIGDI